VAAHPGVPPLRRHPRGTPILRASRYETDSIHLCRRIASSRRFQHGALAVIVANAVLTGVETSPAQWDRYGDVFDVLNAAVQVIFVVEIAVRLLAFGPRIRRCFLDPWNVFDFSIVALSLLPAPGRQEDEP